MLPRVALPQEQGVHDINNSSDDDAYSTSQFVSPRMSSSASPTNSSRDNHQAIPQVTSHDSSTPTPMQGSGGAAGAGTTSASNTGANVSTNMGVGLGTPLPPPPPPSAPLAETQPQQQSYFEMESPSSLTIPGSAQPHSFIQRQSSPPLPPPPTPSTASTRATSPPPSRIPPALTRSSTATVPGPPGTGRSLSFHQPTRSPSGRHSSGVGNIYGTGSGIDNSHGIVTGNSFPNRTAANSESGYGGGNGPQRAGARPVSSIITTPSNEKASALLNVGSDTQPIPIDLGAFGLGHVDRDSRYRDIALAAGAAAIGLPNINPVPVPMPTPTMMSEVRNREQSYNRSRLSMADSNPNRRSRTGFGMNGGGGGGGDGNGNGTSSYRADGDSASIIPPRLPRTVQERLKPTIQHAMDEEAKYARKALITGYALNAAIGLQVFISALITALSAVTSGKRTQVMTSVLGGLGTVVASYLARARGSNEPELSIARTKDLQRFVRTCDAFVQDHGLETGFEDGDDKNSDTKRMLDNRIHELRNELEHLLGNGDGERRLSPPV